jgi:hypothetical protein
MAYTTIDKPDEYFNTVIYTGNGTLATAITGVGFQPDLVWIKNRTAGEEQMWYDAVRGASKLLRCNSTDAEATTSTTVYFNSFDIDGFTVGTETALNANGQNIVAWNWLGANSTASNTAGTITSTVSANTTAGFSIVSWTGTGATATVGHGLGTTPKLFIVKERSEVRNWPVVTTAIDGSWDSLYLNLTDTVGTSSQSADSSVFNFTSSNEYNASGQTYIAYAFADVKGFSKFGSYTGNGSTDGTFAYTGFKPAFVIMKRSDSADNWLMKDSVRDSYNLANKRLFPNQSAAEDTSVNGSIDILSNGFKQRGSDTLTNASGGTYIYMAFAENPFVTSTGIPTPAR